MIKQYFLFVILILPYFLFAQKKNKEEYFIRDISGIIIDGSSAEWKSHLYKSDSELWSFGVTMDKQKICAKVIIRDKKLIDEAVRNGILFNISYSDKKKDGARLLFPRLNLEKLENIVGEEALEERKITPEELIQSTKGYYVAGFNKVVDGLLSFNNQYGIQATSKIDESGYLIYESEIPLQLIDFKTNIVAVQLGVNTQYSNMQKILKSNSSSLRSRGYYGRASNTPSQKNPYNEPTEVWFTGSIK